MLFEAGRAGVAAVELAREIASDGQTTVTLVGIVQRPPTVRGCLPSGAALDAAVRDAVARDLERAGRLLGAIGSRGECRLLVEGADPSLEEFVAQGRFDLVLLPAHRRPLRSSNHPAAAALRCLGAEVRIVERSASAS